MFENYPALLITKLYNPRLRSSHVSREALLASLNTGLERKLILIAAAAGFGKTTLIADWSHQHSEQTSWLSLEDGDNDPTRFLSYMIAAVQTRYPQIGQELIAALQSPQPPAIDNVLPILINQIAALRERLILVLDDYHVIETPAIHTALTFLLEHLPQHMTIVLLTRADPPLPLARLRAKNDLLELRAAALRFSPEDAARFLNETMQLRLPETSVRALETRTEGWIAGLQLAAVAMQTVEGDKQGFVHNFVGSHRFVLDYLIEEVLSRQSENVRRFLLFTSILQRVNGTLCSAVTDETDGQAMIEYLEKNNLFIIPLDQSRYWYRYHHLFAELLKARLLAEYADVVKVLYRRAAEWHDQHDLPEEAVTYALAAEEFEYAAYVMTKPTTSTPHRGEVKTLLDWYRAFPPEFVAQRPRLGLQFGMAFALNGHWDEAETLLNYIQQAEASLPLGELLIFSYFVASQQYDVERLAALMAQAEQVPHPDRQTKVALGLLKRVNGDLQAAARLMAEAQADGEREGDMPLALTALFHRCLMNVFLGNLREAYEFCQQALQILRTLGIVGTPMESFAHVSLGRILIEWNDLDAAEKHLSQAVRLGEATGFVTGMLSSATIMLAEVKQAQGDSSGAFNTAATGIEHAQRHDPLPEVSWLKAYQARVWLTQGNTAAAGVWMQAAQSHPQMTSLFYPNSIQRVTQARVLLAQRKYDEAVDLLMKLLTEPTDLLTVERLGMLALARQGQGDSVHSMLALEQALNMAEGENRVRAFLDLGAPMMKLLAKFSESNPHHEFARKTLALFPAHTSTSQAIEPLGERELEVLRLIAAGYSNEEIAQKLTLALSTVKWYINELYSKLHIKTRGQAIARAHELKLLD
jgi:LuxR family transcriptional regulator, maltose regulon positive regulatory protein